MAIIDLFQQAEGMAQVLPAIFGRQLAGQTGTRALAEYGGAATRGNSGGRKFQGQVQVFVLIAVLQQEVDEDTPVTVIFPWVFALRGQDAPGFPAMAAAMDRGGWQNASGKRPPRQPGFFPTRRTVPRAG
jgi:hypothetical protein